MPIPIALLLGGAALAAGAGAAGSAINNSKRRQEAKRSYDYNKDFLDQQFYRDPLSTTGNRAMLKSLDERMKDNAEALNNRAVAGGATFENALAAKQADNRVMGGVYNQLLQGEDARRDRLNQQRLANENQYSAGLQNSYAQSAKDWMEWGGAMGDAIMQYGSAGLLNK